MTRGNAGLLVLRRGAAALIAIAAIFMSLTLTSAASASAGMTATALSTHPGHAVVGQQVAFAAQIRPAPDGGTVAFTSDGIILAGCGAVPVSAATGDAACVGIFNSPGQHTLVAAYSGDAGFAASRSQGPVEIVGASVRLEHLASASAGMETARLRCAASSGGCHSTVTLSAIGRHRRSVPVLLATKSVSIAAGAARTLRIGLDRTGSELLARSSTLTVQLAVTLTERQVRSLVATRRVMVKAPNPILAVTGAEVVSYAKQFSGVPYVYGGNGPTTFDCSGFTLYVYAHFGYHLARTAYLQMHQGRPVSGPLELGDLIIWDGGGHVGIYTGNQTFISATVHRGIWIYSFQIWSQTQTFATARRILGRPTAGWSAGAASWLPRNGGPADTTPWPASMSPV